MEERFLEAEESIAIAHGAAQDATNDITRLGIGGKLTVGDGEADSAQVVGADTHGDIGILVLAIDKRRLGSQCLNEGLEDIGVVVRLFALHDHAEALKAHSGVDMLSLEGLESAVGKAVVLHEDEVPNLNNERVVLVDQFGARHFGLVGVVAEVDMDLAAGAAGALVAHFPEVVFLGALEDAVLADVLFPIAIGLGVHREALLFVAAEDSYVKVVFVDTHHLGEEFPSIGNSLAFEIVAK